MFVLICMEHYNWLVLWRLESDTFVQKILALTVGIWLLVKKTKLLYKFEKWSSCCNFLPTNFKSLGYQVVKLFAGYNV